MPRKQSEPNYYAVIPANVRYDKSLPPYARLLYAEITSLCNKKGYCWASNSYFAELYGVDRSSITHWIKKLSERGYITIKYMFADGKPNIQERQIFLTENVVIPHKKPPEPEKTAAEEDDGGGEICHQGGGDIYHQGGEITPEIILKANTKSSSSDPPPLANGKPLKEEAEDILADENQSRNQSDAPPLLETSIRDFKERLRRLNRNLIFDQSFYRKALTFMAANDLGEEYASWMYEFCLKQKANNIAGYYYRVFFEPRCTELFTESKRPPPVPKVTTIQCPVCGADHNAADSSCPTCGLDKSHLRDKDKISRQKRLYAMPKDTRAAFEAELEKLYLYTTHAADNFMGMSGRLRNLEQRYGLR